MTTLTISLPESMREFIEDQVQTKGYGNTSEYLRTLVRQAQTAEENRRLELLLLEGLDQGGSDLSVDGAFWEGLRAEAASLISKRKKRS
jgi:antitoxin ParD1/3/4